MSTVQDFQGQDPQILLDWSDDHGRTWSNQLSASMGKVGEYTKRVKWFRLGQSRDRIFRITISDPVKRVIISGHIEAEGGLS